MSLTPEKILPSLAVVDLDRLVANLGVVRRFARHSKVMAVVKANAYGHGDVAVAQTLVRNGVEWLAVQMPEEAIKLRQAGVVAPILILGYTHAAYAADILHYYLTPTIFDYQLAVELDRLSPAPVEVHIKVDTGMSWAGIAVKDAIPFIKSVIKLPKIVVAGLYTHFACADCDGDYTNMQGQLFLDIVGKSRELGLDPLLHACNSAGVVGYPQYHFDMVRPGIMLYGIPVGPLKEGDVLPVLSWTTVVSDMKVLQPGESVSYGATYTAPTTRVIATVPVGYADGWNWRLKNGGHVIIKGEKAPIVGRICMDQFMFDVTDITGIEVGDKVTLIGSDSGVSITASDLARMTDTLSYEILTSLGGRTKFRYNSTRKEAKL